MSFVITTPEFVGAAAQDLAGINSTLAEAATAATTPTTRLMAAGADEISTAVAELFGNFGQEFHALAAQASAFHEQFVGLLNASAGAYLSTEIANAERTLASAVNTPAQSLANDFNTFGAAVAAPYQALGSNTATNLQAIRATFSSNPFPFLHQLANDGAFYGRMIATGFSSAVQNLPAELANAPAAAQAGVQGLAAVHPGALLQQFVDNQIGYAQTIATSLQSATHDLGTGLARLPASFQTAFQELATGDFTGAVNTLGHGFENVFFPSFEPITVTSGIPNQPLIPLVPAGPLGDLLPVFAIPGHIAQNLTNLLPAGSIPAHIAQNATNLINVLTDFGATLNPNNLNVNFGLPLQFLLDGIGAPVNGLVALNSSATAFVSAVQTGNVAGAAAAVLDAPAVVANGFLNGRTVLDLPRLTTYFIWAGLPFPPQTLEVVTELPLGGLLAPLSAVDYAPLGTLPGTPIGGLIPGLLTFGSELAHAIDLVG